VYHTPSSLHLFVLYFLRSFSFSMHAAHFSHPKPLHGFVLIITYLKKVTNHDASHYEISLPSLRCPFHFILFMIYLTTISLLKTKGNWVLCRKLLNWKASREGIVRGLISCTVLTFAWSDWGGPGKTAIRYSHWAPLKCKVINFITSINALREV